MDDFPTVYWPAWNVDSSFLPGTQLPLESQDRLWAVLTIVFYGDKVVLADIRGRGLCIPSGKIEAGETIDEASQREAYEETGARLDSERRALIGCYRLVTRGASNDSLPLAGGGLGRGTDPAAGRVRFCPVFVAEALGFEAIPEGSESQGVQLAPIEDVAELYFIWDDLMAAVFAYAEERRQSLFPSGIAVSDLMQG